MKKLLLLVSVFMLSVSVGSVSANEAKVKKNVADSVSKSMAERNVNVNVDVQILKKLDEPKGYYFIKVVYFDKTTPKKIAGEQYLFSNGDFIVEDFINLKSFSSLSKDLSYEMSSVKIDVSKLTLVSGNPKSKNILVEVSDYQCNFCKEMTSYLKTALKKKKDYALYIMHLPIRAIHPRAETLALVYEAGKEMGKDFMMQLFDPSNGNLSDIEIVEKYSKLSGNPSKFKKLINSKELKAKVAASEAQALELGISATPVLFVNGKKITGFDKPLIDKALKGIK